MEEPRFGDVRRRMEAPRSVLELLGRSVDLQFEVLPGGIELGVRSREMALRGLVSSLT
jgi:hypothetical protein